MPEVSVLLTTYNRRHCGLLAAISSVLTQTFQDFELIVLDDGSTDDTAELFSTYWDNRINYRRLPHSGIPGVSLNHGLKIAKGRWVTWLCDDDLWKPTMLEAQLAILQNEPEVAVYTLAEGVAEVETHEGYVYQQLLDHNFIPGTMMWDRRIQFTFNEEARFRGYEDWLAWLDIAKAFPIVRIPEKLRIQNITPGSISQVKDCVKHYKTVAAVYDMHGRKSAQAKSDAFWGRFPAPWRYPFAWTSRQLAKCL